MTGLWSLTQAPDSLCSGMALSGGGRLYVSMCDGVMLTVLGAELGKLTFSGVLNRPTEERLLYQTWKTWSKLKSLSCEVSQESLGDGEGRKCGPECPLGGHTACIKETLEVLSLV